MILVNSILSPNLMKAHLVVSITHKQRVSLIMWIPSPIYERLPQFWLLLGLLFVSTGLYLGFEFVLSFYYVALGGLCCVYAAAIFLMRLNYRQNQLVTEHTPEVTE